MRSAISVNLRVEKQCESFHFGVGYVCWNRMFSIEDGYVTDSFMTSDLYSQGKLKIA